MNRELVFFIFGGTGDLARRKLYPVLQNLYRKGKLRGLRAVYALGRNVDRIEEYVRSLEGDFAKLIRPFEFDVSRRESYDRLGAEISGMGGAELILYLALPPQLFETTILHLGSLMRKFSNPRKIVVEKPFGFDLSSARRLNFQLKRYFTEREIYRIDHFLGKVPIQNILSVRFSNYVFEGIWNKNFIDNIQISALEDIGLEGRASYYDRVGALRDMVQNHLLQILSFLAMEPPAVMEAERVRDEKVKVLSSIRHLSESDIDRYAVRGRYRGYLEELGRESNTETYAAVKLFIDNFRWEGVPFYLRTGKRLKRKVTQAVVVFKEVPGNFGRLLGCVPEQNKLVFEIAPSNRVMFFFEMAPPEGFLSCPVEREMELELAPEGLPEAYETLLEDIAEGNQTLFIREDEAELAWEVVQPIIDRWSQEGDIPEYEPGSWGPKEAEELIGRDGRSWIVV
ncbi:glucose-6-phosphate dehydrogenase [Hydrogenivirga sp. 128-5-R1-1]|uniref:glucose-6-phosphate dehydrogenase n=1 Tax=Hydrogenivirga sp. 128-5-R1-1 TaxID=392423 RepID=UPI00015F3658|nr:glucose-6-phosphate dehydrogenase [Hydrogenivirga sp. 128-5-R1-1]EDP76448.1 glucose-6-phosphate 1-dehydrogenase [Hydrogenivirga sp. 128-5-R1-1]